MGGGVGSNKITTMWVTRVSQQTKLKTNDCSVWSRTLSVVIQRESVRSGSEKTGSDIGATESNRFQQKGGNIDIEIELVPKEKLDSDVFGTLHLFFTLYNQVLLTLKCVYIVWIKGRNYFQRVPL